MLQNLTDEIKDKWEYLDLKGKLHLCLILSYLIFDVQQNVFEALALMALLLVPLCFSTFEV